MIAVDGKVVRGSRTATVAAIQLLAAIDHHGVVLAQRQVASKSNEIPSFAPLLDGLEPENTVLTSTPCTPNTTTGPIWPVAARTTWPS